MADYGAAFLAAGVVVGGVLLLVALIAYVGWRYRGQPASSTTRRRLARFEIGFGLLMLVYAAIAVVYGGGMVWILGAIEGPLFIAMGWMQLRYLQREQHSPR